MTERFDRRFTAFGIGFPWAVAFCFAAVALILRRNAPEPMGVHWQGHRADWSVAFPAFVLLAALLIGVVGSVLGALAGARLHRRWLRRVFMAAAIFWSLLIASISAGLLMGQQGVSSADDGGFDATVFALGSGAALALGIVMFFVFQPIPRWNQNDERALATESAALAGMPRIKYWVHMRSSSFVLLAMIAFLVGGLLLLMSSWISLTLVLILLLLALLLFGSVTIDGGERQRPQLRLKLVGVLTVVHLGLEEIESAEAEEVALWQRGGPGWRWINGTRQFLTANGLALHIKLSAGPGLLVSVPRSQGANELASYLLKRRGTTGAES